MASENSKAMNDISMQEGLFREHALRQHTVGGSPPTERFGYTDAAVQPIKFGHDANRADNTDFFNVGGQNKVGIVGWAGHMLADMFQEHLHFYIPDVGNIDIILW